MRKDREDTTRVDMTWNPQGKTRQGRSIGKTWGEAEKIAENRVRWKDMVETLRLTRGKEDFKLSKLTRATNSKLKKDLA